MSMEQWWNDTDSNHYCTFKTLSTETSRVPDWDGARVSAMSGRLLTTRAMTWHLFHKENVKTIIITLC